MFVCTILFLATGFLLDNQQSNRQLNYKGFYKHAQIRLVKDEKAIELFLNQLQQEAKQKDFYDKELIGNKQETIKGFNFFIYEKGSLRFWSDNQLIPASDKINSWHNHKMVRCKNGWYEVFKRETPTHLFIGMYLIKHQYA